MKMTRDLINNTEQIKKDARALYEMGVRGVECGITREFHKYFDEHYEYEMEDSGLFWFGEVMTDEQLNIYNEYTNKVRYEIYKMNRSDKHELL